MNEEDPNTEDTSQTSEMSEQIKNFSAALDEEYEKRITQMGMKHAVKYINR